jgi:Amidase
MGTAAKQCQRMPPCEPREPALSDFQMTSLLQLRLMQINGSAFPALFCVPMCIKDNIDVVGTATTAGKTGCTHAYARWQAPHPLHDKCARVLAYAWQQQRLPASRKRRLNVIERQLSRGRCRRGESTTAVQGCSVVNVYMFCHVSLIIQTSTQVRGLRRRGAVILAKANMGEFAWSPFESRGSLFGVVRNPYNTSRTVAGAWFINDSSWTQCVCSNSSWVSLD